MNNEVFFRMANSLSTRLDHDALASIPRDVIARDTSLLLDGVKHLPGERVLAAGAAAFVLLCERYGGNPSGLNDYGNRVVFHQEQFHKKGNDQFEALRDWLALLASQNPAI